MVQGQLTNFESRGGQGGTGLFEAPGRTRKQDPAGLRGPGQESQGEIGAIDGANAQVIAEAGRRKRGCGAGAQGSDASGPRGEARFVKGFDAPGAR